MPQVFRVLQCYACKTFQVDIVKKTSKWTCKICHEKQSLKTVFGSGTAKDCRMTVQSLNKARMMNPHPGPEEENSPEAVQSQDFSETEQETQVQPPRKRSKWSGFVEEDNQESPEIRTMENYLEEEFNELPEL